MAIKPITQPEISAHNDAKAEIEANIETMFDSTLKAFSLVVLDEINLLRAQAGLPERTVQQLKNAVKARL